MAYSRQKLFVLIAGMSILNIPLIKSLGEQQEGLPTNTIPLHVNCMAKFVRKSPDEIKSFLRLGLDVHTRDVQGNTYLHLLAKDSNNSSYSVDDIRIKADLFLKAGIDITAKNKFGDTALNIAQQRYKTYESKHTQSSAILTHILQEVQKEACANQH